MWKRQDRGHTLVLTLDETEMVYYRPARFLPNTAAGEWTLEIEGHTGTMRLGKEASCRLDSGGIIGHYRCWASSFGKTMTVLADIPGCGAQLMLFQYERQGDRLKLTPITWKGP